MVWSGTWKFTPPEVAWVTRTLPRNMKVLASQRNAKEYAPIAGAVDGNAYYWSSLDPVRDVDAQQRLDALGRVVHEHGGLWLPSVAPGFDATLLGGHRVVERRDGQTLREEWELATDSAADAIGIVSWNEFSENSHIEPSQNYGNESLREVVPGLVELEVAVPRLMPALR